MDTKIKTLIDVNICENILCLCKIPDFVDIKILKEYVKKDIDTNKEYFDDRNITYRISDSKKAEWMLHKCIKNSKLVGDGNKSSDILVDNEIHIDVSVLTLNGNSTNEKSIMQNFSESNDLDGLFNNNDGEKAVDIFKNKFIKKCSSNDKYKKDIYYLIFVCKKKNVYLICLKLNTQNIPDMKFGEMTKKCKSIVINNFIDNNIGNVKLYKSKKRLELRLCKTIISNEHSIKLF
jgi:predicted Fe-Mo cluster-binding NifX family protein